ncbi:restriction endonuclease subunit S [Methanocalculus sp.]|uniref:restriction endonuclease subunit S n=1 Tax=Methanocalculus sp. TaxID=2004547 RepID=UPI002629DCE3|nr:restriction endonuclease subunit S [Methanocalculus sp.]MDG6249441.1 restriction endonuclease subunit S [Methanocalculus sp.]
MPQNSELPEGWIQSTINDISDEIKYGYTASADKNKVGPHFLRITDIQNDFVDWNDVPFCSIKEEQISKYKLESGDIVFARTGATTGKSYLISSCPDSIFASYLIRLRPNRNVNQKFMSLFFSTSEYWTQISQNISGIAQPNCNATKLKELKIPLPPLAEQHRIVAAIEALFARLDAAQARLDRVPGIVQQFRQAVLAAACEGRLTEDWRSENPDITDAKEAVGNILNQKRMAWEREQIQTFQDKGKTPKNSKWKEKYREPKGIEISDLPIVSDKWTWASIDQVSGIEANSITDGPFGSNLKTEHYTDSGPRVIRLQNLGDGNFIDVKSHISTDHFTKLKKHQVFPKDLVIGTLGDPIPRACQIPDDFGPAIVKADCIRLNPHQEIANNKYVIFAINTESTRKRMVESIHGVGRARLNLSNIKSLPIPLPPLSEQDEIVHRADALFALADQIEARITAAKERTETLRQSILAQAFSGQLVSTEAELARREEREYEPASVLLERIKAKK